MKFSAFLFLSLLSVAPLAGCSGSSGSASGGTTLSCMTQLSGFAPGCQYYEATGPDAVSTISSLRAGCVDQSGLQASVVGACPTQGSLGGCKTPVTVEGGAKVSLSITNVSYTPGPDAGGFEPTTVAQVEQMCSDSNGTYVPVP